MNKKTSVSVIVTVLQEKNTILLLLKSLVAQTLLPDEIIITDGGSIDGTQQLISHFAQKNKQVSIVLLNTLGNRSVGRNAAINYARNELIAITDAGCIPEKNWIEELVLAKKKTKAEVVAGSAEAICNTRFEEAAAPFFLVMPDKIDHQNFLPATRSMLMQKSVWEKACGFDESLSHNEDFAFSKKIKKIGVTITYSENAKVWWQPPSSIKSFGNTIYRFALGDTQAGIFRPKVLFVFVRYLIGFALLFWILKFSVFKALFFVVISLIIYSLWATLKLFKYAPNAWYFFPLLQILADFNVLKGSVIGTLSFGLRRLQK